MKTLPEPPPRVLPLLQQLQHVELPRVAPDSAHRLAKSAAVELKPLQALAEGEPGLALAILLTANARSSADEELRGLQQSVHRLGSGGVQRLLRALPALQYDREQPGHLLALRAMATSRLAWLFLAHWLRAALASDEDARLAALTLLGVARWKLPLAAPALADQIERRIETGERRSQVERELLGADLDSINAWHLRDLGLPCAGVLTAGCRWPPALLARASRPLPDELGAPAVPARLKSSLRERGLLVSLAQALALEVSLDWHSTRARALVRAAAAVCGRPVDDILRGVHRQALFASQEARFGADAPAPAAGLLRPPRPPRGLQRRAAPAPSADAGSAKADIRAGTPPPFARATTLSLISGCAARQAMPICKAC